jgi:hypothetical protein
MGVYENTDTYIQLYQKLLERDSLLVIDTSFLHPNLCDAPFDRKDMRDKIGWDALNRQQKYYDGNKNNCLTELVLSLGELRQFLCSTFLSSTHIRIPEGVLDEMIRHYNHTQSEEPSHINKLKKDYLREIVYVLHKQNTKIIPFKSSWKKTRSYRRMQQVQKRRKLRTSGIDTEIVYTAFNINTNGKRRKKIICTQDIHLGVLAHIMSGQLHQDVEARAIRRNGFGQYHFTLIQDRPKRLPWNQEKRQKMLERK